MRRLALVPALIAVLLLPAAAPAASPGATDVSAAAARRALDAALDAFREPLAADASAGDRDVTAALRDLAVALPALRGNDRARARDLLARPTNKSDRDYFGKEAGASPVCDPQFCVHWTEKAKNRPASQHFLNEVEEAMAHSYDVENGTLGWRPAKSDGKLGARHGIGDQGQVDVYITDLGKNLYGYASTDPGQRSNRRHAFLVLDNDYAGFPSPPVQSMQVTAAHEYNHILQFGYDVFEDVWLFEDTATWAEEQVYPLIDDYLNYLPAMAQKPQKPMTGSSIKIYAEAVWNHWLAARYGPELIRNVWEVSQAEDSFAVAAYDRAIDNHGGRSFARELGDFFAATAEWQGNSAFPDHTEYPSVDRSGKLTGASRKTKLDNTAYRLYNVKPRAGGSVTLEVKVEKGTRASISLVGRDGGPAGPVTTETDHLGKGGKGEVTLTGPGTFSRITAVVANVDGRSNRRNSRGKRVYRSDGSSFKVSVAG